MLGSLRSFVRRHWVSLVIHLANKGQLTELNDAQDRNLDGFVYKKAAKDPSVGMCGVSVQDIRLVNLSKLHQHIALIQCLRALALNGI